MKIGLIGNDTSHVEIFSNMLHDTNNPFYIEDAQFAGFIESYSEDLAISRERAAKYKQVLLSHHIPQFKDVKTLNEMVDAWWIMTVDGNNHQEWFEKIVPYQKPIFIDKPITIGLDSFNLIVEQSEKYNTPIFSSSSLRFSESLHNINSNEIDFVYAYGPLPFQDKMPGYYWYGIHSLEWIDLLFDCDVKTFEKTRNEQYEIVQILFEDGRRAIFRGEYEWHDKFGGVAHVKGVPYSFEFWKMDKPYYASLLEEVIYFYHTKKAPIDIKRTKRILSWIEELLK